MKTAINIVWFEQDLRLSNNPALAASINQASILPIYILDNENAAEYQLGGASRWWLHHSLTALNDALNGKMNFYKGDPASIIADLCRRFTVTGIYWNRRYEPWRVSRDKKIKQQLLAQGIHAQSFNGSLLNEPWTILKKDNSPYQVFTPYYRQANKMHRDTAALPATQLPGSFHTDNQASSLDALSLLSPNSRDANFDDCWTPGELGAQSALHKFLHNGLANYREGRDFPGLNAVSSLSPHLHFGEISPCQINEALLRVPDDDNREHFKRELIWREFSYYLLFHCPRLPVENLKANFNHFPWDDNPDKLARWQQGLTGYPIVDAGMRELMQTGYMHNRVRMIAASFLVKNLLIDWRLGARWFWDCLVDADLASNSASWQWVAGCGTDAAPYFRIFNPITQGEKFDAQGTYTKSYLPELQGLPTKYLFRPWEAPPAILKKANITLGQTYPLPIVDIKESRAKALSAYEQTKHIIDS